jgi:hypothetical protein
MLSTQRVCSTPFPEHIELALDTEIKQCDLWHYLKYAFRARNASEEVAKEIN